MVHPRALLTCALTFALATLATAQVAEPIPRRDGTFDRAIELAPQRFAPANDSHRPRPGEEELNDVRRWLLGQKGKQTQSELDPQKLKDLLEKLNRLPKDQQPDPMQVEKLLKDNPQFRDPAFLQQLAKLLEDPNFPDNLGGRLPKTDPLPGIDDEQALKDRLSKLIESGKLDPNTGLPRDFPDPGMVPDRPDLSGIQDTPTPDSPAAQNEWVKWLEKNFKDSPAAEAAMKDLVSALEKPGSRGMFDDIPEFKNGNWKDLNAWGKANTSDLWKIKPPDVTGSRSISPRIGSGGTSPGWTGGGAGGGIGSGGSGGLEGGGIALAVIAGIVGAIVLAILLTRKWKLEQAERLAAVQALPTPIDFDSIRTREELVQVFDTVSLGRCGEDARNWNHRVIAEQFATAEPAHAGPADEVAGLYERARYAPEDEELTASDFAAARRDLRAIAGASA
jgi:hypothetical protein